MGSRYGLEAQSETFVIPNPTCASPWQDGPACSNLLTFQLKRSGVGQFKQQLQMEVDQAFMDSELDRNCKRL